MITVPEFPLVNCKKNCCVRLLISWVPCLADSVSTYWFCTISGKALLTMKHYPQWNGVGKLHFKEVFEERAVVLFQHKNSVSKVWFFFFFLSLKWYDFIANLGQIKVWDFTLANEVAPLVFNLAKVWGPDHFITFSAHYLKTVSHWMSHTINGIMLTIQLHCSCPENVNIISQNNINPVKNCTAVQQNQLDLNQVRPAMDKLWKCAIIKIWFQYCKMEENIHWIGTTHRTYIFLQQEKQRLSYAFGKQQCHLKGSWTTPQTGWKSKSYKQQTLLCTVQSNFAVVYRM